MISYLILPMDNVLMTKTWCLVYVDGQGMFCSMCRQHDVKMNTDLKKWNSIPTKRCRTATISSHLDSATSVHRESVNADERQSTSHFDREQEKQIPSLKDEVHFKIFQSLHWLAKEEMPSSKISSLLKLIDSRIFLVAPQVLIKTCTGVNSNHFFVRSR